MMDADGEWAPPSARDAQIPDPDRDLARRFSREPDVRARARLLGMDWTALKAARLRLVVGSWLVSGGVALAILLPTLGVEASGSFVDGVRDPRYYVLMITLGGVLAYFARLFAGGIARRIVRDPRKLGTWEQHRLVEPAMEALWFAGFTGAALLFSISTFEDLGLVAGGAIASMLVLRPVSRFPVLIERNYLSAVPTFLELARLAPRESLLGYRVRWLLLDHAAVSVGAAGLTLITLEHWWLIIPAAALLAVFGVVAARASLNRHPRLAIYIRAATALALAVAAVQFLLGSDGMRLLGLGL